MTTIRLDFLEELHERFKDGPSLIQVILGPRQVGKTTGVDQFLKEYKKPYKYYSADELLSPSVTWVQECWQACITELDGNCLLVIDEIQKIENWSSVIKKLWDQQKLKKKTHIKLILLGSSSLQIQKGLTESLTGRFEIIHTYQWSFAQSEKLGLKLEAYLSYGGYPASYEFLNNKTRWQNYINDSIVQTVVAKDILKHSQVRNLALFLQAFSIICSYPAQEISYNKLLGQLQDKGNTALIKSYLHLYEGTYLIKILNKYSTRPLSIKSSSPKIIIMCPALVDSTLKENQEGKGHIFESTVGSCFIKAGVDIYYWRDGGFEVDYVIKYKGKILAVEVKSGRKKSPKGLHKFCSLYPKAIPIFITHENFKFLDKNPISFLEKLI